MTTPADDHPISSGRRRLFAGLAGLAAATALPRGATAQADPEAAAETAKRQPLIVPFHGEHQAGIVTPQPYAGLFAAFDILAETREELGALFALLTERSAFLMRGGKPPQLDPGYPPADSGILGPDIHPERLTVTLAVGASLFDERFGLASLRPPELVAMPAFPNDALDAELCHGDLLVQICAETPEETLHALRHIIRHTPDQLSLRWKQEGFSATHGNRRSSLIGTGRNLLGFKDGTANPDVTDAAEMRRLVWVGDSGNAQAWATGGSYQVIRLVRNYVERWDRTPLGEQEAIFGRRRDDGAPLGRIGEFDDPDYAGDPEGKRIRLANPAGRRGGAARLIRRGFNYSNGVTKAGQLDMGLAFVCFQASLKQGFAAVQERLNGEPLEEYIKPFGGGYFFALPGVPEPGGVLGGILLAAAGIIDIPNHKG
jgi:deferrochelatase/peroxidase EfeB